MLDFLHRQIIDPLAAATVSSRLEPLITRCVNIAEDLGLELSELEEEL